MRRCAKLALVAVTLATLSGCAVAPLPGEVVVREHPAPVVWQNGYWHHWGYWHPGYWRW